ncbi:hypothetical protein CQW23_05087 [Capsicum baccatum]|uniref:AB hydrolase-1 domain-containing protein n=1 Tax=Capsicum baccatum TaxID=33114 RepID=A0A2G2XGX1_CAPBA|nr:hypothetical protein CQW23_05087 [Capsicum baccatum]
MSTSIATARTELLNPIGNWLDVPGRSNHFRGRWKIINRRNFSVNRIVATGSSIMTPCVAAESSQVGLFTSNLRYNLPELAKRYKVYALDLLGFGWSEKAKIDYDALIWRDQVVDFLKEVVKQPAVLVGNSLGGFTALLAAAPQPETNL